MIIAIGNQKGGVGKSTISSTLVDGFTRCGYKTLHIDIDPQTNSTSIFKPASGNTLYEVMEGICSAKEAIQKTKYGYVIPGSKRLNDTKGSYEGALDGPYRLKKALKEIENDFDFIIIDTPPDFGIFLRNALIAADKIIIPMKVEKFAIDGLKDLIDTINTTVELYNPKLRILGTLIIAYDARQKFDRELRERLPITGKAFNFRTFKTVIRVCQKVNEAQKESESIFDYDPKGNASADYVNLVKEIVQILQEEENENDC